MMTNMFPKACIDEIHGLQRNFIWGDTYYKRKLHAIKWDMISRPKSIGGVAVIKKSMMILL